MLSCGVCRAAALESFDGALADLGEDGNGSTQNGCFYGTYCAKIHQISMYFSEAVGGFVNI